jgi:hypothetical protein
MPLLIDPRNREAGRHWFGSHGSGFGAWRLIKIRQSSTPASCFFTKASPCSMWCAWTEMACGELRWLLENRDHGILFRSVLQPVAGDMHSEWCHHIICYMRICMIFSGILFYKGIQKHVYLVFNCRNNLFSDAMWWNCVLKTLFFLKKYCGLALWFGGHMLLPQLIYSL